ncbi:MAG: hypothetical protein ACRCTI_15615 [Beijerinckiaceae bacterium]
MDWGIDPDRVAEVAEIIRNRKLPAADAEKVILAIVGGGGENVDQPLWDMAQILFCLGHLTKQPRMGPRDAATACLLDETGMFTGALRRAAKTIEIAPFRITGGPEGVAVVSPEGERSFAWSRVKRAMAIGDFLFNSPFTDPGAGTGVDALRLALDTLFLENASLTDLSKRAVQGPARYMRAWRKKYLPLQAFADLIRVRETYLAERNRTREGRSLDAEDVFDIWRLALQRGETWSFARYAEKLAALIREERTDADRRAFLQPVAIDALVSGEPSEDPEAAIIAWLDRDEDAAPAALNDNLPEPQDPADDPDAPAFEERTLAALSALPEIPKVLTKEERRQAAAIFALNPLCHEQPLTLLRAVQAAVWENRLVEASRRGAADGRGGDFNYPTEVEVMRTLDQRFGELILMALHLASGSEAGATAAEGAKLLKKWRHDRSSFRMEDAKLAQSFAMMGYDLRVTAQALRRVLQQLGRLVAAQDLAALSSADEARFGQVFATRYNRQADSR